MRPCSPYEVPLFLLVLAFCLATATSAAASTSGNFIENPGFEVCQLDVEDGLDALHASMMEPGYWWPMHASPNRLTRYTWDASALRSGTYTAGIDTRSQDASFTGYEAWGSYVDATVLAGRRVKLTASSKLDAPSGSAAIELRVHAFQYGQATAGTCGAACRASSTDSGWMTQELVFQVPEGTSHLLVQLGISGQGGAWFDDARLVIDSSASISADSWTMESADPRCMPSRPTTLVVVHELSLQRTPAPVKPWNIILYAVSDFAGAYSRVRDFASDVYANEQLNVLVFEDPHEQGATLYTSTCTEFPVVLTPILTYGETDSADAETITRVLTYAEHWFPAEHTLLCLYGHGMACWGACTDDTSTGKPLAIVENLLSPPELQAALQTVGGVDALMFTAPCLMSSLEAAYQVRHLADVVVASEELSGYWLWKDAMPAIVRSIALDPSIEAEELGRLAIAEMASALQPLIDQLPYVVNQPAMAATTLAALADLADAVDAFSLTLIDAMAMHSNAVIQARDGAEHFFNGEYADLYDFANRCLAIPGLGESATHVMEAVDAAVIAQTINDVGHPDGHGINIFFPRLAPTTSQLHRQFAFPQSGDKYRDYGLTFLEDTHWHEFLQAFFAVADS